MLFRQRRWLVGLIALLVLIGAGAGSLLYLRRSAELAEEEEEAVLTKQEAPPDLEKFRDRFLAGVDAIQRNDGEEAVLQLSSFSFGTRRVEEYRLYYLANAQQLRGDPDAARRTLSKLWRRTPSMVHTDDAAFHLGNLYANLGDWRRSAGVYAALARRDRNPAVAGEARWQALESRIQNGDVAGALYSARSILIHNPTSGHAADAEAIVRALSGSAKSDPLPLTPSERLERAASFRAAAAPEKAIDELARLAKDAPSHGPAIRLERGLALYQSKKFEDSIDVLEPLTSGPFKYSVPALRHNAKSYATVAASIDPFVYKTVKERKRVGTVNVRVGKGKNRRTVRRAKYQTVFRKVKLVDLPKKEKKEDFDRLASERLKDLLSLEQIDEDVRLETLHALIARAEPKHQDDYLRELVPQVIAIDNTADPALQYFWDKGWEAYTKGDLSSARDLFKFIDDTYTHPNIRRQSRYWYARSIERLGKKEEAASVYRELASAPYADLYAIYAIQRGAKPGQTTANPLNEKGNDWREIAEKEMPESLQLAYELTALSAMRDSFLEIRRNLTRQNRRFGEALLADVYHSMGNELLMYRSLRTAWPQLATVEQDTVPGYFLAMYYPRKYGDEIEKHAKENDLDPNLVRALILQESYYNPKAKSRVGATGLMQLMPPTASEHGRALRIPFAASRLENPDVNVQLGTYHLRKLMQLFGNNPYLAVAAYNAGQGNVGKWRRAAGGRPLDEVLESIPFQETRNYVKRVTMLRSAYTRLTS